MITIKIIILISVLFNVDNAFGNENKIQIETLIKGLGTVVGVKDTSRWSKRDFYSFTGIKFAETPIGDLRFKAPVPVKPWDNKVDATKPGRLCPQGLVYWSGLDSDDNDEDCLHLSVYTPKLGNGSLPVLVYLHGGSWYDGGASQYPPHYYMEEDIVLVVPQYRLSTLGYLSLEVEEIPGNAGFLDMILALKWVQDHIHNFGGDPQQVTLNGQSAGAASVMLLLQSPLVDASLFHRAIVQSGGSLGAWVMDSNPIENTYQIAKHAGCPVNTTMKELIKCLKETDANKMFHAFIHYTIQKVNSRTWRFGGSRPTVGGPTKFLSMQPSKALRSGKFRTIPIMAGVTQHEGSFLVANAYSVLNHVFHDVGNKSAIYLIDNIIQTIGILDEYTSGSADVLTQYAFFPPKSLQNGTLNDIIPGLIDLFGVYMLKGPLLREVQLHSRRNENIYLYSFNYYGEHSRFLSSRSESDIDDLPFNGGVSHSNDNIYLFPWPAKVTKLNEEDTKMSKTMIQLWTSFVKTGKPTSDNTPEWKPFTEHVGPYMKIDKESVLSPNFLEEFSVSSGLMKSSSGISRNSYGFLLPFLILNILGT